MPDSAGKKLSQARLRRNLTIDEAAHATKMRPDKILALENDDLSRFGNTAYAKGFLMLYARFLHVDVSEEVRALDVPHDLRVRDYQYLNNAAPPEPDRMPRFSQKPKTPSALPLVIGAAVLLMVALGFYLRVQAQRLGIGQNLPPPSTSASAPPAEPVPEAALTQASTPPPADAPADEPAPVPTPAALALEVAKVDPAVVPQGSAPEIRRAEPAAAATTGINEVTIGANKKTRVKVWKDDRNSAPVFVDDLYPNDPPLTLRGARFFVEAREPESIEIRKNGAPIAYQAGVSIQ
jgi:cytoskeletal protein RodZ